MQLKMLLASAMLLIAGLLPATALAASEPHLNYGPELSASACGGGTLVINVTQKIVNDVDSGEAGNNWAFDALTRHIQVWQTGEDTFCATVSYEGKFSTIEGERSPGNTVDLGPSVTGTFSGGYRGQITGTLNPDPAFPTRGNIGTFDYECDPDGNCPGYVDWISAYFTTPTFTYEWWGWEYRYKTQRWINATDGNSGDITG